MNKTLCVTARGILFDMDGVLISSIGSVVRSWRRWAKLYDVPDAENFEVPHGMRAKDVIKTLRPDIDLQAAVQVIEDMEVDDVADLRVLAGVKALLAGLAAGALGDCDILDAAFAVGAAEGCRVAAS